jgi:hypothetical protein
MTDLESNPRGIVQRLKRTLQPEKKIKAVPKSQEPESVVAAKAILNSTKLTEAASYWSGLPANREYYDERELKKIYDLVRERGGKPAAHSFANMVLDMPSLAPSNLVRAFISLSRNNWVYDSQFSEHILAGNTDIRPVKEGEAESVHDAVAEGFFGRIATTVDKDDDTRVIKEGFETILGDELKAIMASREIIDVTPQK